MSIAVDADRDQDHGVDHPAAFADLHRQRVGGNEGERSSGVKGTVAELIDELVQIARHPGDLRLAQRVDPEGLDQLVHSVNATGWTPRRGSSRRPQ